MPGNDASVLLDAHQLVIARHEAQDGVAFPGDRFAIPEAVLDRGLGQLLNQGVVGLDLRSEVSHCVEAVVQAFVAVAQGQLLEGLQVIFADLEQGELAAVDAGFLGDEAL